MNDLISRQAAIDDICNQCSMTQAGDRCIDDFCRDIRVLKKLPSAQPEIVRCKDCTKCQIDSIFHDYWCEGKKVWKDHYCGYAERRTNERFN